MYAYICIIIHHTYVRMYMHYLMANYQPTVFFQVTFVTSPSFRPTCFDLWCYHPNIASLHSAAWDFVLVCPAHDAHKAIDWLIYTVLHSTVSVQQMNLWPENASETTPFSPTSYRSHNYICLPCNAKVPMVEQYIYYIALYCYLYVNSTSCIRTI